MRANLAIFGIIEQGTRSKDQGQVTGKDKFGVLMDVLEASRFSGRDYWITLGIKLRWSLCSLFFVQKISAHLQRAGTYDIQLTTKT